MIQPHEAYPERIVFLNRPIHWSDISESGGSGLIFPKNTMFFILTGKIIPQVNRSGYFIYVLTSLSPSAGQWLMNLNWLDLTPASINTGVTYDIHIIMEHVNKLESKTQSLSINIDRLVSMNAIKNRALSALDLEPIDFYRVGVGEICPKCFMEWHKHLGDLCPSNPSHINWREMYEKELLNQFEKAITVNEFYDGYDETEWMSVESNIRNKLKAFNMTSDQIQELREKIIHDQLKLFYSQDTGENEISIEEMDHEYNNSEITTGETQVSASETTGEAGENNRELDSEIY